MCGIAGFWKNDQNDIHAFRDILKDMSAQLYHRGPDGYGFHVDERAGLGMGHARLSIIDLETGEQPLLSHDKEQVLTVNGEFYDYKRIRTALRLEGFQFACKSDSEIALPLYKKYGLDFVEHLRGEFAISLYDQSRQRLVLVRDRFGIKPLFYHINKGNVYYGSEIKALLAHPDVPSSFDNRSILHQLMHTTAPGTSLFKDIYAVKPGHMLILERHGNQLDVKEHCYWDMDFPEKDEREHKSEAHYIQSVREELSEAVFHRLEADVPVGCYLSGGIDSCSMLGLASGMQQSPVKAFTISFDHKAYDESAIAKEMADRVGADQEQISLKADDLYGESYIKTLWHAERAFYNTLGVAKYKMSQRVNECGYRVVVTGEGSDELFGGYPAFKRDMLLHGHEGASAEELESYRKLMDESNKLFKGAILAENQVSHPALEEVCGFTPSWIQPWMQTLDIASPLLHDDILEDLRGYDPIQEIATSFDTRQLNNRHVLDKAQYTWIKTMLECQILNWGGDRVDMANSMESRPAFLDHHVAEAAKKIPPHMRIKGNVEKWVLREAMKNVLPETLYKREKFAFMAPPGHTENKKKAALDLLLDSYLNEDKVKEIGIFDPKRLSSFIRTYKADTDPVSLVRKDALINHLLGLHILHDLFVSKAASIIA
ncbi:asparagine synthase (glutamine-hydrolyzing) [Rapidithrix thailandica]|uniref:asparagine synthase (glutamine-hydrolyzing) n=1 Tax=Rapidithrix thailandica TaxID=413964 RepID=A0AAW9S5W1_9BACT